jgi:hypothetical protein
LEVLGWKPNVSLISDLPIDIPKASYTMAFQKMAQVDNCDARHLASLELCFDNRQAIAGHLAKADMAARSFDPRDAGNVSMTVLAVLTKAAKVSGGWDGSVGTFDEYDYAIDGPFKKFIESPVRLLSIT